MDREERALIKKCYKMMMDSFKPEYNAIYQAEDVLVFLLLAGRTDSGYGFKNGPDPVWPALFDRNIEQVNRLLPWFSDMHRQLPVSDGVVRNIWTGINAKGIDNPAALLGAVHEIALDIPGDRKKQGSYYTPPEIVNYMVEIVLGRMLNCAAEAAPVDGGSPFRVIDPACGSAVFLSAVLRDLIKINFPVEMAINQLYGIDSDPRAVDLTVLGLALDCSVHSRSADPEGFISRLRPQIRVGNALTLNWQREFPEVFNRPDPGFDLVIGNPPYISNKKLPAEIKAYINSNYQTAEGQYDIIVPFLEKGLAGIKKGGCLCFIISNKYLAADYGRKLRTEVLTRQSLLELTDLSSVRVFADAAVYPVIQVIEKGQVNPAGQVIVRDVKNLQQLRHNENECTIPVEFFRRLDDMIITPKLNKEIWPVMEKLAGVAGRIPAKKILCGIARAGFSKWVIEGEKYTRHSDKDKGNYRPFLNSGNIDKFLIKGRNGFIPAASTTKKHWHSFAGRKLVIAGLAKKIEAVVDSEGCALGRVYYIREEDVPYNLYYLCAIYNSGLMDFYYRVLYWPVHLQGDYYRFNSTYLARLPVADGNKNRELAGRITGLAYEMHQNNPSKQELQDELDRLVFQLYGLTAKQITVIKNFTKKFQIPEVEL